jgi:hypothetical protein
VVGVETTTHKEDQAMESIKELVTALRRLENLVLYTAEGLRVGVTVDDARRAHGRVELRVSPRAGGNSAWVSTDRVAIARAEVTMPKAARAAKPVLRLVPRNRPKV